MQRTNRQIVEDAIEKIPVGLFSIWDLQVLCRRSLTAREIACSLRGNQRVQRVERAYHRGDVATWEKLY